VINMDKFLSCKSLTKRKTTDTPQTISREVSASKKRHNRFHWSERRKPAIVYLACEEAMF